MMTTTTLDHGEDDPIQFEPSHLTISDLICDCLFVVHMLMLCMRGAVHR